MGGTRPSSGSTGLKSNQWASAPDRNASQAGRGTTESSRPLPLRRRRCCLRPNGQPRHSSRCSFRLAFGPLTCAFTDASSAPSRERSRLSGNSMDWLTLSCRELSLPNLGRGNVHGCGQLAFGAEKPDRKSTRPYNEIRTAVDFLIPGPRPQARATPTEVGPLQHAQYVPHPRIRGAQIDLLPGLLSGGTSGSLCRLFCNRRLSRRPLTEILLCGPATIHCRSMRAASA